MSKRKFPTSADSLEEPVGFCLHEIPINTDDDVYGHECVHFYVPEHLAEELRLDVVEKRNARLFKKSEQREKERLAAARQKLSDLSEENIQEDDFKEPKEPEQAKKRPVAGTLTNTIDTSKPPKVLPELVEGEDYDPTQEHPVFRTHIPLEMHNRAAVLRGKDRATQKSDMEMAARLAMSGQLRRVANPESVQALEPLYRSHPNFKAVIDLVRNQLLLAKNAGRPPRIPPLLLDGEPGLGKTHFASQIAAVLGAPVQLISFDAQGTAAALVGTDRHWSTSSAGKLFETICLGDCANPVFLLDELDKSSSDRHQNPLLALHTLLEPSTAVRVRDLSVDIEFDASLVTWIATTNCVNLLLPSLRSRFTEFHIERPNAADSINSANVVVASVFFSVLQQGTFQLPGKEFSVALAHFLPREVKQATEQALANAVANGRSYVTVDDIPQQFSDEKTSSQPWLH